MTKRVYCEKGSIYRYKEEYKGFTLAVCYDKSTSVFKGNEFIFCRKSGAADCKKIIDLLMF